MESYNLWKGLANISGELNYLAEGNYGTVFKFRSATSNSDYVVKEFKPTATLDLRLNEIYAMSELKGMMFATGLLNDDSCFYDESTAVVKMNYFNMNLTMLNEGAEKNNFSSIIWRLMILRSMFTALIRFQKHNLIHLDLKPDNLLMRNEFDVVLSDFNFTIEVDPSTLNIPYPLGKHSEQKSRQPCLHGSRGAQ